MWQITGNDKTQSVVSWRPLLSGTRCGILMRNGLTGKNGNIVSLDINWKMRKLKYLTDCLGPTD